VYPARFMLMAATNPCPCGYAGERDRCRCGEGDLARHRRRLSGPLLDRIDLLVNVGRIGADHLAGDHSTSSAAARERVREARERQTARLRGTGVLVNSRMDNRMLRHHLHLDDGAARLLTNTRERRVLSERGQHRALRVARTIADLARRERVEGEHLAEALSLRPEGGLSDRRVA
jgi:magnesium chelatase family protein